MRREGCADLDNISSWALPARPGSRPGRRPAPGKSDQHGTGCLMTSQPLTTGKSSDAEPIHLMPPADGASERSLVARLSLTEKVQLLTGADSWRTSECQTIGLRSMVTSDGPAGVRGTTKDERRPSACLPCPSAFGATWDPQLVHRLGAALGADARSKGVDVLLAPTV